MRTPVFFSFECKGRRTRRVGFLGTSHRGASTLRVLLFTPVSGFWEDRSYPTVSPVSTPGVWLVTRSPLDLLDLVVPVPPPGRPQDLTEVVIELTLAPGVEGVGLVSTLSEVHPTGV